MFREAAHDEAFHGGCPIVNLAVESDDADPQLRDAARRAMARLISLFERVIAQGTERGEFAKTDPRARATLIVATLEGALLLSNLYKDRTYKDRTRLHAVIEHLARQIRNGLR